MLIISSSNSNKKVSINSVNFQEEDNEALVFEPRFDGYKYKTNLNGQEVILDLTTEINGIFLSISREQGNKLYRKDDDNRENGSRDDFSEAQINAIKACLENTRFTISSTKIGKDKFELHIVKKVEGKIESPASKITKKSSRQSYITIFLFIVACLLIYKYRNKATSKIIRTNSRI